MPVLPSLSEPQLQRCVQRIELVAVPSAQSKVFSTCRGEQVMVCSGLGLGLGACTRYATLSDTFSTSEKGIRKTFATEYFLASYM